jgi:DNA-directed RNA polymerase subunit RPC12/RpoP
MSEFKFACPVCGQHITADSKTAGSQLDCPTCFRKIVVPQGASAADAKFILSASEANKPRPPQTGASSPPEPPPSSPRKILPLALIGLLVLAGVAGAVLFVLQTKVAKNPELPPVVPPPVEEVSVAEIQPGTNRPAWTLDLSGVAYPGTVAAGRIHGRDFVCGRAILDGGTLTLRHRDNPEATDLGLNIYLPARLAEELSGKSLTATLDNPGPPRVVVRWKEGDQGKSEEIRNGYALKVQFGTIQSGRISGKIYICLPDSLKSIAAGTFNAEIRVPAPH